VSIKIIPRLFGGLGNQLFIYAAARRLALVNNAELVLDNVSGFARDRLYNRKYELGPFELPCRMATPAERLEPFPAIRRRVMRVVDRARPFNERRYVKQDGLDFDKRLLRVRPQSSLYLEGYWQSEGYFEDVGEIVRADLHMGPLTDQANKDMADLIHSHPAVAVHVRFFEPPQTQGPGNAPPDYYVRALQVIEDRVPRAHYFVFSDNPSAAATRLPLPSGRVTVVQHNQGSDGAYADLWLMSQCRHFVIANSTFSWWGAWLGSYKDKTVVAPSADSVGGLGVGAWGFSGLLPERWLSL
jgi:hypothetical protein